MDFLDDPKFSQPTDALGDWHVAHSTCFEHDDVPSAVKFAIEKITGQFLRREPFDSRAPVLRYTGRSSAGGHPCTVHLELVALSASNYLYRFESAGTAPRRWEQEEHFTAACEHRFAHWCGQLQIVPNEQRWPSSPRAALATFVTEVIAAEAAGALIVEDIAPVIALQRQVLDALRGGMYFVTASKEGGSRFLFDGQVFRRKDYSDGPDRNTAYPDDASMIDALRRFYDWDACEDNYPHPKPEVDVWRYIHKELRPR